MRGKARRTRDPEQIDAQWSSDGSGDSGVDIAVVIMIVEMMMVVGG